MSRAAIPGLLILAVLAIALWLLVPTREGRLRRFVDETQKAFVERREADFLASFDPAVRYQTKGGLAEVARDFRKFHALSLPAPRVLRRDIQLDPQGADVGLDVVLVAGLRPLAQVQVRMRVAETGDLWRVTSVSWQ